MQTVSVPWAQHKPAVVLQQLRVDTKLSTQDIQGFLPQEGIRVTLSGHKQKPCLRNSQNICAIVASNCQISVKLNATSSLWVNYICSSPVLNLQGGFCFWFFFFLCLCVSPPPLLAYTAL